MERMGETVSIRAIQKVADESNCDQVDLPPLYESIEPDALNTLVDGMSDGEVSFSYAGREVTVDSNEVVRVREQPTNQSAGECARSDD
ncbi:HalOD1 output domain-containing protein [Halosimplex amylolyticum]|uniref:HalOD1 output domain-containing protein n=1 Tax=Halosimplex amylolyticum TaxID=3396616 RepID=UPI003F558272